MRTQIAPAAQILLDNDLQYTYWGRAIMRAEENGGEFTADECREAFYHERMQSEVRRMRLNYRFGNAVKNGNPKLAAKILVEDPGGDSHQSHIA